MRVIASRLGVCLMLLVLPSCSNPGPTLHPVSGQVFFKESPAAGALVQLHSEGDPKARILSAIVGPDGRFEVTTTKRGDGAEAGRYIVTLSWSETVKQGDVERETPDKFKGRYSDRSKSKLTYEVVPGTNEIPKIDVN